jgi:hypothetical protein
MQKKYNIDSIDYCKTDTQLEHVKNGIPTLFADINKR